MSTSRREFVALGSLGLLAGIVPAQTPDAPSQMPTPGAPPAFGTAPAVGPEVSAATFKELIKPMPGQDYAAGWIVTERPWAGGRALTHAGSNTTWYCNVWIAPNKDFAVLIATNTGAKPVAEAADQGVGLLIKFNSQLDGAK